MTVSAYQDFVASKRHSVAPSGFDRAYVNPAEHDFQSALIDWTCRQGRAAVFADCGLGKTLMQLVYAQNVHRETNQPVLILAPLSVSAQTVEEAEKFDIQAVRSRDGSFPAGVGIVTANYEMLHRFDSADFGGVVCDESSIIKNANGSTRQAITAFMRRVEYRALFTATPSPNDFTELGTSSEALGYMGHMDMLGRFFRNAEGNLHPQDRGAKFILKPHAERDFWRWLVGWARAIRRPSDMGFDDREWVLPKLIEMDHAVESGVRSGDLFPVAANGFAEEREERAITLDARCGLAADLLRDADSGVAWVHLNAEADAVCASLDGSVNLSGSDSDDDKIEKITAFKNGEIRHLVTKPKIAAFGVNWQHCANATYFADYSYEQYYQAVRRFYRFGQTRPVIIHNITTTSLEHVSHSRKAKGFAATRMFDSMMDHVLEAVADQRSLPEPKSIKLPEWIDD